MCFLRWLSLVCRVRAGQILAHLPPIVRRHLPDRRSDHQHHPHVRERHQHRAAGCGEWYTSPSISADGLGHRDRVSLLGRPGLPASDLCSPIRSATTDGPSTNTPHTPTARIAISPSGATLGCLSSKAIRPPPSSTSSISPRERSPPARSWSRTPAIPSAGLPDGRHIAFDMEVPRMHKKRVPPPPSRHRRFQMFKTEASQGSPTDHTLLVASWRLDCVR